MFNSLIRDKVFIIAEAGVNHNGSYDLALKLIDAAADAGVDAVKFQTFKADKLVTKKASKAEYQKATTNSEESQFDMLKRLELSEEHHMKLSKYCKLKGIIFMSTPFDLDSVDILEKIDIGIYKIGSGDLTNMPLIKKVARLNRPVIISTGMSNIEEVLEARKWILDEGNENVVFLHCTTEYPAPLSSVHLRAMNTLKVLTNKEIGYSDHTEGIEIAIAAVALGARVIEKHFTLDKEMEGPDHKASIDVKELKELVKSIRNVELALGNNSKVLDEIEKANSLVARKGIVSKRALKKGQKIGSDDIDIKRPGIGIQPKFYYDLTEGYILIRDIDEDEPILWDMVEKEG